MKKIFTLLTLAMLCVFSGIAQERHLEIHYWQRDAEEPVIGNIISIKQLDYIQINHIIEKTNIYAKANASSIQIDMMVYATPVSESWAGYTMDLYMSRDSVQFDKIASLPMTGYSISHTFKPEESGKYYFKAQLTHTDGTLGEMSDVIPVEFYRPNWEAMGIATYTEDIVLSLYSLSGFQPYEVPIERCTNIEGLYRLVNPYGVETPWGNVGGCTASSTVKYFYINASNPNKVFICNESGQALEANGDPSFFHTGFNVGAYGEMSVTGKYNFYLYQGKSDAEAAAGNVGTLKNGVITFPTSSMLIQEAGDNALYTGNRNGNFMIVLPGAKASSKSNASAPKLTIQKKLGIKMQSTEEKDDYRTLKPAVSNIIEF